LAIRGRLVEGMADQHKHCDAALLRKLAATLQSHLLEQ
jgi:hypothetical protein